MYGYGYSLYNRLSFLGGLDPNASAFLTATGITNPTIQGAVNSLVVDLKKYGLWSKMKAIYPFVGGTATTHKFNLVNPANTDAAFRLGYNGGISHTSNGVQGNGVNGYADTFLRPSTNLTNNSFSIGLYTRDNIATSSVEMGCSDISFSPIIGLSFKNVANNASFDGYDSTNHRVQRSNVNSNGFIVGTVLNSTSQSLYKSGVLMGSVNTIAQTLSQPVGKITLMARNDNSIPTQYSSKSILFSFIGDGLTDEDSANLYYSVQKFQTTLGRQVGTPIYSSNATDVNARLFLGATNIQDATITSAVDTLVQGLKTDGIWTKLKAVYPFVGGTATTHKFNLANALDEDTAFRLAFSGGWTHSANGALPNGTNGYANSNLIQSSNLTIDNNHISVYSRTNTSGNFIDCGITNNLTFSTSYINSRRSTGLGVFENGTKIATIATANSLGYNLGTSVGATSKLIKNGNVIASSSATQTGSLFNSSIVFGCVRVHPSTFEGYSNRQYAFATIGDGLTDIDAANLYTRVQAFQTSLSRAII